jgi:hypothetical protein
MIRLQLLYNFCATRIIFFFFKTKGWERAFSFSVYIMVRIFGGSLIMYSNININIAIKKTLII